jgi:hypothetical protein
MPELPPLLVLQARAEAWAYLFAAGDCTLGEAFEPLEHYAIESGLLDDFGRHTVDRLIVAPFEPFLIPGV